MHKIWIIGGAIILVLSLFIVVFGAGDGATAAFSWRNPFTQTVPIMDKEMMELPYVYSVCNSPTDKPFTTGETSYFYQNWSKENYNNKSVSVKLLKTSSTKAELLIDGDIPFVVGKYNVVGYKNDFSRDRFAFCIKNITDSPDSAVIVGKKL